MSNCCPCLTNGCGPGAHTIILGHGTVGVLAPGGFAALVLSAPSSMTVLMAARDFALCMCVCSVTKYYCVLVGVVLVTTIKYIFDICFFQFVWSVIRKPQATNIPDRQTNLLYACVQFHFKINQVDCTI